MTEQLTYGFARKRDVPNDGGRPKVCPKCQSWFSVKSRERICAGCRPAYQQARMAVRVGPVKSANAQVSGTRSDALSLTFRPGVPLWRVLAFEAAAEDRWAPTQRRAYGGMSACVPDCICDPCLISRPKEYAA